MKITSFLLLLIGLLSCTPTAQKTNIKSISVSTYGGDRGYSRSVKITKDSIFSDTSIAVDSTENSSSKKLNTQYKLQDLVSDAQLDELNIIKNGESRQPVDGTDTSLIIETDKKTLTITNGESSGLWRKIVDKINSFDK
ncbi:hypothetical protein [Soonwooa sp.]|uniref:hypothetical protein n=1 Tax=Soonwooa sp. TaxID=1938592 RepID=UPI002639949F|nr:hypothetical protein [Soonwooa sp.]